jgi:hypothetical protein
VGLGVGGGADDVDEQEDALLLDGPVVAANQQVDVWSTGLSPEPFAEAVVPSLRVLVYALAVSALLVFVVRMTPPVACPRVIMPT